MYLRQYRLDHTRWAVPPTYYLFINSSNSLTQSHQNSFSREQRPFFFLENNSCYIYIDLVKKDITNMKHEICQRLTLLSKVYNISFCFVYTPALIVVQDCSVSASRTISSVYNKTAMKVSLTRIPILRSLISRARSLMTRHRRCPSPQVS